MADKFYSLPIPKHVALLFPLCSTAQQIGLLKIWQLATCSQACRVA